VPSQKQLKWSSTEGGLTVLAATVTLGVLNFPHERYWRTVLFQNQTEILFR